jgi:divalent metal cation (Fe/Co/Zn/Cd) transporter
MGIRGKAGIRSGPMLEAISRLVVSVLLIVVAGFLYWCAFHYTEVDTKIAASNIATAIFMGNLTYWLRPAATTIAKKK